MSLKAIELINYHTRIDQLCAIINDYSMRNKMDLTVKALQHEIELNQFIRVLCRDGNKFLDVTPLYGRIHFDVYKGTHSQYDELIDSIALGVGCVCYTISRSLFDHVRYGYVYAENFIVVPRGSSASDTTLLVYNKYNHSYLIVLKKINNDCWDIENLNLDNLNLAIDFMRSIYGEVIMLEKAKFPFLNAQNETVSRFLDLFGEDGTFYQAEKRFKPQFLDW